MYIQGAVLRVKTQKPRRNRAIMALLLPAVIFLWIVGWGLYWIGRQRDSKQVPRWKDSREHVHLETVLFEEPSEIVAN